MPLQLENLRTLKHDMILKDWVTDSFFFDYNERSYVVLARRYIKTDVKPDQYASMQITFFDRNSEEERMLSIPGNAKELLVEANVIKEYFKVNGFIAYNEFMFAFNEYFGSVIPTEVNENKLIEEINYIYMNLSKNDSDDPNKKYITHVQNLPVLTVGPNKGTKKIRSLFNTQKTRMRYRDVYDHFNHDKHITFCYSFNPDDERNLTQIVERRAKNNKKQTNSQ